MNLQQAPPLRSNFQAEILILEPQLSYTAAALQPHLCLDMHPTDPKPDQTHGPTLLISAPCGLTSMDLPGRHWTIADPDHSTLIKTLNCLNPWYYHYGFVWWPGLLAVSRLDVFLFISCISCGTFPQPVEKATTFACLPVTLGYWLPLTDYCPLTTMVSDYW